MAKRCGVCGKRTFFGTLLKCNSCGQLVCHRHDREQFRAITVHGMGEATPLGPYTQLNYPDGGKVGREFECYSCRTGRLPTDMGQSRWCVLELYFISAVLLPAILMTGAFFGALLGLAADTVDSIVIYSVFYVLTSIPAIFVMAVYYRRKGLITVVK